MFPPKPEAGGKPTAPKKPFSGADTKARVAALRKKPKKHAEGSAFEEANESAAEAQREGD